MKGAIFLMRITLKQKMKLCKQHAEGLQPFKGVGYNRYLLKGLNRFYY